MLRGNAQRHKAFVYGLQTARDIINGSPSYGVRSVRSPDYRYLLNLTPDAEFRNVVRRSIWWKSWEQEALMGDNHARAMIARYTRRPREER